MFPSVIVYFVTKSSQVEHALSLYEDKGSSIHDQVVNVGGKGCDAVAGPGFLNTPWGSKAFVLRKPIGDLTRQHWAVIDEHAKVYIQDLPRVQLRDEDEVGDASDDEASYPHAHIIIDWYVLSHLTGCDKILTRKGTNVCALLRRNN